MEPDCAAFLEAENLGINFGGIQALKDVTFRVEPGKIVGVIGPNGAGKTTLFNLITGVYRASTGKIRFQGKEMHGLKPSRVCHAGIGRTFQSGRPFTNMTALENVLVGLYYGGGVNRLNMKEAKLQGREILEFVGLGKHCDRPVSNLNLMERKIVELARALATKPKLLLLDEILAGLNPTDLADAIAIIQRVRDELGVTILWIEHIMKVLMDTCEYLIVLHYGEKLAEGEPLKIANDTSVVEAYFGKRGAAVG